MRVQVFVAFFWLITGCGEDELLDPTGTWSTNVTFGAGDCGLTGTFQDIFTVTKNGAGYTVSSSDPAQTIQGTTTCTVDECQLSIQGTESGELEDGTPYTATVAQNATVDTDDKITGSGSISITPQGGATCTQQFAVTGTKS